MGVLIDTSVLVELERSGPGARSVSGAAERPVLQRLAGEPAYLAAITASELLHGVHRATGTARRARRQAFVEALLDLLPVVPFDLTAARVHAGLWAELSERGEMIGAHDLLISATALARDPAHPQPARVRAARRAASGELVSREDWKGSARQTGIRSILSPVFLV